jgi:hypothetical protein
LKNQASVPLPERGGERVEQCAAENNERRAEEMTTGKIHGSPVPKPLSFRTALAVRNLLASGNSRFFDSADASAIRLRSE